MKVRVPKELRPPERFKPFPCPMPVDYTLGLFRCTGSFRIPKLGEFYWSIKGSLGVLKCGGLFRTNSPRVILERVSP